MKPSCVDPLVISFCAKIVVRVRAYEYYYWARKQNNAVLFCLLNKNNTAAVVAVGCGTTVLYRAPRALFIVLLFMCGFSGSRLLLKFEYSRGTNGRVAIIVIRSIIAIKYSSTDCMLYHYL